MSKKEIKQTLYKKDSKNKIRFLTVSTLNGELIQESGIVGTDSPVRHSSVCTPKNVGRSNETTSQEQAILEAQSKLKGKKDEGYFDTQEEVDEGDVVLPMLAKDYKKEQYKVEFPFFVQRKYDGMRMLAFKKNGSVKLFSRKGKEILTLNHIVLQLQNSKIPDNIYDGEAYGLDLGSFQEQMKAIKKYRPGETEQINFNIYDAVLTDQNYTQRLNTLSKLFLSLKEPNLLLADTYRVEDKEELNRYHRLFLSEGFEGTIIRLPYGEYKVNGRSSNLLKYKDFQDLACIVTDILPSDRNPEQGVVQCEINGVRFGCGMKFSHNERAEMLENKKNYIGLTAEIRFFEYTDSGLPRFPVCVGFRLDK